MAWNPTPEVAVSRDAAERIGAIHGSPVDLCVVLYTLADGRIGYASYGTDRAKCAEARKLADKLYDRAVRFFGDS